MRHGGDPLRVSAAFAVQRAQLAAGGHLDLVERVVGAADHRRVAVHAHAQQVAIGQVQFRAGRVRWAVHPPGARRLWMAIAPRALCHRAYPRVCCGRPRSCNVTDTRTINLVMRDASRHASAHLQTVAFPATFSVGFPELRASDTRKLRQA